MSSVTRHITTAEELLAAGDIGRCELVRGELRMMTPAGFEHGDIAIRVTTIIAPFVRQRRLGIVLAAETGFILSRKPDTVRAPDVAFVQKSRVPKERTRGYFPGAPDLAVEVLSPDDRASEVIEKVHEWLDAGAQAVWVVDPRSRTVSVALRGDASSRIYAMADTVPGEPVLPGLSVSVKEIFEYD